MPRHSSLSCYLFDAFKKVVHFKYLTLKKKKKNEPSSGDGFNGLVGHFQKQKSELLLLAPLCHGASQEMPTLGKWSPAECVGWSRQREAGWVPGWEQRQAHVGLWGTNCSEVSLRSETGPPFQEGLEGLISGPPKGASRPGIFSHQQLSVFL